MNKKLLIFIYLGVLFVLIALIFINYQKRSPVQNTQTLNSPTPAPTTLSVTSMGECKAIYLDPNDPEAVLPDKNCTPGVVDTKVTQENIAATICKSGYTKTVRPSSSYTSKLEINQIEMYGYTDKNTGSFEEDHLIPLELGGNPTDPKNLWPQPHASPNKKDKVENLLHKKVCDGEITLTDAQKQISDNWFAVYMKWF